MHNLNGGTRDDICEIVERRNPAALGPSDTKVLEMANSHLEPDRRYDSQRVDLRLGIRIRQGLSTGQEGSTMLHVLLCAREVLLFAI